MQELTPQAALEVLVTLTAEIPLKRADHQTVAQAIQVLSDVVVSNADKKSHSA